MMKTTSQKLRLKPMFLLNVLIVIDQGAAMRIRFVDYSLSRPPMPRQEQDLFYDRLVAIRHHGEYRLDDSVKPWEKIYNSSTLTDHSSTVVGVIINKRLVLTTYNPFRQIIKYAFKRHWTYLNVMRGRTVVRYSPATVTYSTWNYDIVCARQVVPATDDDIGIKLWHGFDYQPKMHSPIHDLMVLRVERDIDYYDDNPDFSKRHRYNLQGWPVQKSIDSGPIVTKVATPDDKIGRSVTFVSLGYDGAITIKRNILLRMEQYKPDDNVMTDCEEWFPREWGWFFCLKNTGNFVGMDSGSVLFSNELLFGMGCFSLYKGNQSVFVFTDVRKYYHLLNKTCSEEDQKLNEEELETTTEKKPSIYWVQTNVTHALRMLDGEALVAGTERWDGSPLWIIRAAYDGALVPGKLAAKHQAAFIPLGKEVPVSEFEVLCVVPVSSVEWVWSNDGQVPKRTLAAGYEKDGSLLYICRVNQGGSLTPGKVVPERGCYVSHGGSESFHTNYEILLKKKKHHSKKKKTKKNKSKKKKKKN